MSFLVFILIIFLIAIAVILFVVRLIHRSHGILSKRMVYTDTTTIPGSVLYDDNLGLKGKPDYIVKVKNAFIPVEVKTGKTPEIPYRNHVAQLFAYCALVEVNYGARPEYGIIKYPEREFEVEYTKAGRDGLSKIIDEMKGMRDRDITPACRHPEHNKE